MMKVSRRRRVDVWYASTIRHVLQSIEVDEDLAKVRLGVVLVTVAHRWPRAEGYLARASRDRMAGHRPCDGLGTLAFTAHQGKEYAWTSATSMLADGVVPVVTVCHGDACCPATSSSRMISYGSTGYGDAARRLHLEHLNPVEVST